MSRECQRCSCLQADAYLVPSASIRCLLTDKARRLLQRPLCEASSSSALLSGDLESVRSVRKGLLHLSNDKQAKIVAFREEYVASASTAYTTKGHIVDRQINVPSHIQPLEHSQDEYASSNCLHRASNNEASGEDRSPLSRRRA